MSTTIMEGQLFKLLNADSDLQARGCQAVRQKSGGIAVVSSGHHRGLWTWQGNAFAFMPGGYTSPTSHVETAAEAVIFTRTSVCPDP